MTANEIERAAKETIVPRPGTEKDGKTLAALREGFKIGALYMRNAPWHYADERPENDRAVLGVDNYSHPVICGPNNSEWENTVESFGLTAWAYTDDLLPSTFNEKLEANKDVLKRLKEKGD